MVSDVDLKGAEVEYPAALLQFPGALQPTETVPDLPDETGGDVQPVVAGQDPVDRQTADPLDRREELPGVGGGVEGV